MTQKRSWLLTWCIAVLATILVPAASSAQQSGDEPPGTPPAPATPPTPAVPPPPGPGARASDPLARYRGRSPYQTLAPSPPEVTARRAGVPLTALRALPPPVCAKPPPPEPVHPPEHVSNAVPYLPFPATWQQTLDSFVAERHIPGAVIIVQSPDWGVRVGVTGLANLATHAPMAPWMQFRIGSVTKFFLAQAILRLEQDGKIKLSAPVLTYLGGNPTVEGIPNIDKITVGELLQMTAGVANYLDAPDIGWSPQLTPTRHFDPADLIAVLSGPHDVPPYFAPGFTYANPYWWTVLNPAWGDNPLPAPPRPPPAPPAYPAWAYSNSNYILLGLIAEKVTGLKAEEVIRRYVIEPAGLGDTFFATDTQPLPAMHGYTKYGSIPYPNPVYSEWCDVTETNPSYAWTAGAIVSTPWDLLKLTDIAFTTDKILDAGTRNKWYTFVSADSVPGWEPMQYGVGGLLQPARAYGTARGHGGAIPGYHTLLYYFPDQKTSFVLASNTWDESWEAAMLDTIMPQVSSAVTTPRPADGGFDKRSPHDTVHVAWQAGRVYGASYNVYSGTNAERVDRASATLHEGVELQTVTGLAAEVKANPGTTYWRVDTVAPGQDLPLVIGPVWRFRTR